MRNSLGKTVEREGLEVSAGIFFIIFLFIFGKPEKGAVNGRRDKLGGSESWEGKRREEMGGLRRGEKVKRNENEVGERRGAGRVEE